MAGRALIDLDQPTDCRVTPIHSISARKSLYEAQRYDTLSLHQGNDIFVGGVMARGSRLPNTAPRTPRAPRPSVADRLFAALDDRRIESGSTSWVARVLGIHMVQRAAWVQIGPAGDAPWSVLLHLSPHATADHAMAALTAWSQTPPHERPLVVEVMRLA
jgi:hypothetical protein